MRLEQELPVYFLTFFSYPKAIQMSHLRSFLAP